MTTTRMAIKAYVPTSLYTALRSAYRQRKRVTSQAGQDFWVAGEVFNGMRRGYFLEVGAADGLSMSNTFILERKYSWQGICIEANPLLFKTLKMSRRANCVNACVDAIEGMVDFAADGFLGGIVSENTDNHVSGSTDANVIRLKARRLDSILASVQAPRQIDYFSLDAEGAEDRILGDFPYAQYQFNCLTIERPKPSLREILKKQGYVLIKEIPQLDCFYIHESFLPNYHKNLLDFWRRYA